MNKIIDLPITTFASLRREQRDYALPVEAALLGDNVIQLVGDDTSTLWGWWNIIEVDLYISPTGQTRVVCALKAIEAR